MSVLTIVSNKAKLRIITINIYCFFFYYVSILTFCILSLCCHVVGCFSLVFPDTDLRMCAPCALCTVLSTLTATILVNGCHSTIPTTTTRRQKQLLLQVRGAGVLREDRQVEASARKESGVVGLPQE